LEHMREIGRKIFVKPNDREDSGEQVCNTEGDMLFSGSKGGIQRMLTTTCSSQIAENATETLPPQLVVRGRMSECLRTGTSDGRTLTALDDKCPNATLSTHPTTSTALPRTERARSLYACV
jgi:hypothetical protein